MTYSYKTHSKHQECYNILFESDVDELVLLVKFLPKTPLVFSKDKVDLQMMKLRDPEMLLYTLEAYGLTQILKGF